MTSTLLWRWARIAAGSFLLVLGVIGLFLPVLQGVVFIVMGLTLLSHDSPRAKRALDWIKGRLPERHRASADAVNEEKNDA